MEMPQRPIPKEMIETLNVGLNPSFDGNASTAWQTVTVAEDELS